MAEIKAVLCDASSLIALTESCFLGVLSFLRSSKVNFIIPEKVKYECIGRPMSIKKHSLHAIRLQRMVDEGALKVVEAEIDAETKRIMELANKIFYSRGKPIHLIDIGEAAMIALAKELGARYILMDERTTRTLIESPERLKEHFEREFRTHVATNENNLKEFGDICEGLMVFRSSEIIAIAYDKGYFNSKFGKNKKKALEAGLYSLKFNGCAISFEEIESYIKTVK